MIDSKITAKGQTTLPRAVREALAVEAGDQLRYIVQDGEVRIRLVRPIGRLFGMLKNAGPASFAARWRSNSYGFWRRPIGSPVIRSRLCWRSWYRQRVSSSRLRMMWFARPLATDGAVFASRI